MELQEHKVNIDGVELILNDLKSSNALNFIIQEALHDDEYKTKNINFTPGDVVIDIGANIGAISVYLAKKHPGITVYSFEAHPINYKNLLKNIADNNITNILPFNYALYSSDNDFIDIRLNPHNTGATNSFVDHETYMEVIKVPTITLDTIIEKYNIDKIKFLKVDCEGAEFEIFENSKLIKNIPVDHIGIEIHSFFEHAGEERSQNLVNLLNSISSNCSVKMQ